MYSYNHAKLRLLLWHDASRRPTPSLRARSDQRGGADDDCGAGHATHQSERPNAAIRSRRGSGSRRALELRQADGDAARGCLRRSPDIPRPAYRQPQRPVVGPLELLRPPRESLGRHEARACAGDPVGASGPDALVLHSAKPRTLSQRPAADRRRRRGEPRASQKPPVFGRCPVPCRGGVGAQRGRHDRPHRDQRLPTRPSQPAFVRPDRTKPGRPPRHDRGAGGDRPVPVCRPAQGRRRPGPSVVGVEGSARLWEGHL